jgi:hypothetical protein
LPQSYELRAVRRRAPVARGSGGHHPTVLVALHRLNEIVAAISVPEAIWPAFQAAVAALSIDDLNPPGTSTPSGGEGAAARGPAASKLRRAGEAET